MVDPLRIIAAKRDGGRLSAEAIEAFVLGFSRGDLPDYQAAAFLMAVYIQGMDLEETLALTSAMVHSGGTLDLSSLGFPVVDKHSTGGVGDKTTLVVAPLVAAAGVAVGKMSGRGLGFTGGTIDKLEAIPGFRVELSKEEFVGNLRRHGIAVSAQTPDLAPADGKLYALRDATATVESIPLIASSIMAKKVATGAAGIVLDVKVGAGSLVRDAASAQALAELMTRIGESLHRPVSVVMGDMDQPLGRAVGNSLEVLEAIKALQGSGAPDLMGHCLEVARGMWLLANPTASDGDARRRLEAALAGGAAARKLKEWISAQGGQPQVVSEPALLPSAPLIVDVPAETSGRVVGLDAKEIGLATMELGAGRKAKEDEIDPSVGVWLHAKVGDRVARGDPLFTLHAGDRRKLKSARGRVAGAYRIESDP